MNWTLKDWFPTFTQQFVKQFCEHVDGVFGDQKQHLFCGEFRNFYHYTSCVPLYDVNTFQTTSKHLHSSEVNKTRPHYKLDNLLFMLRLRFSTTWNQGYKYNVVNFQFVPLRTNLTLLHQNPLCTKKSSSHSIVYRPFRGFSFHRKTSVFSILVSKLAPHLLNMKCCFSIELNTLILSIMNIKFHRIKKE